MTPGFRFGHYEIRRELGRGAMGVVYEAFDTRVGRLIAIKLLKAGNDDTQVTEEIRLRFRREGEVGGRLVHPNIVAVYDLCDGLALPDGSTSAPFIVMEYVEGGDLKSRLAGTARLALPQVAQVMGQLLSALQHAHERGIVHRDVKPANVLMRDSGRLKLTDFGIARIADSELTQTGEVMGTMTYMSPEQLTGAPIDARADVYACGVILYELLTGEPPFSGSATTIMQKILNQQALPPSTLNPTLPKALDDVVRTAIAKRPAERFADAKAFEQALAGALFDADDQATLVRPADVPPGASAGSPAPAGHAAAPMPSQAVPAVAARPSSGRRLGVAIGVGAAAIALFALAWFKPWADRKHSEPSSFAAVAPPPSLGEVKAAAAVRADAQAQLHSPQEIERMAWDHARAADSAAAFEAYLRVYPDGAYAKLAHVHLAVLAQHAHVAAAPSSAPAHP